MGARANSWCSLCCLCNCSEDGCWTLMEAGPTIGSTLALEKKTELCRFSGSGCSRVARAGLACSTFLWIRKKCILTSGWALELWHRDASLLCSALFYFVSHKREHLSGFQTLFCWCFLLDWHSTSSFSPQKRSCFTGQVKSTFLSYKFYHLR